MSDDIPLKVICRRVDVTPRLARAVLRGSRLKRRNGARWVFSEAQAEEVADLIKKCAIAGQSDGASNRMTNNNNTKAGDAAGLSRRRSKQRDQA